MRKVVVNEFMSLDGVAQAPGGANEDTSGGFAHGGWHMRYMEDEVAQKWVLGSIVEAGGFVLGRRTYEIFAAYWPNAPEEEQVIAEPLNGKPKYVASTTLTEPVGRQNSDHACKSGFSEGRTSWHPTGIYEGCGAATAILYVLDVRAVVACARCSRTRGRVRGSRCTSVAGRCASRSGAREITGSMSPRWR